MKKCSYDNLWLLATFLVTGIFLTELAQASGIPEDWQARAQHCQQQAEWQMCAWPEQAHFGVQARSQGITRATAPLSQTELWLTLDEAAEAVRAQLYRVSTDTYGIKLAWQQQREAGMAQIAELLEYRPGAATLALALQQD